MKKNVIEKEIKSNSINNAAEKFAKVLVSNGYYWAAEQIVDFVGNGYYSFSNASRHILSENGMGTFPKSNDWSYYWSIKNIDENTYYASFIERALI